MMGKLGVLCLVLLVALISIEARQLNKIKKEDGKAGRAFCGLVIYQAEIHVEMTGIYYGMAFQCNGRDRYEIQSSNPQYHMGYISGVLAGWYLSPQVCDSTDAGMRCTQDIDYPQDCTDGSWEEHGTLFWTGSSVQVDCLVTPCSWVMVANANANQAFRNGYYELLSEDQWCHGRPSYSHLTSADFLFFTYSVNGFVGWMVGPTLCINYGGLSDATDVIYPQNAGGPWQQYTNGEWIFNYQLTVYCTSEPTTPGPSTLPPQCQLNDALKNRCASDDISQDDCINIEGCCWDDSVQTTTVTGTAAPTPSCYEPVAYTTPDVLNDICTLPNCGFGQTQCWPNDKDCTTYYTCRDGVWELNSCPEGWYVNPYDDDCQQPCISGDTSGCQILQQCVTTPAPTPPSTMDPCYIPPGQCDLGACTVNPYDCQGYLKCQESLGGRKWVPQVCGSPQNYINLRATSCALICANFDSNVCNITSNCVTPNSPTYTAALTAPPYCVLPGYCLQGQCRPKLDDCSAYWYCSDLNNEIYMQCDNGTYVNTDATGDCAYICSESDLQTCQDNLAMCGTTTQFVSTTAAGHYPCHSMDQCSPGQYYVDRSDCHYYLVCIYEEEDDAYVMQPMKCPSNYVFDPSVYSCVDPATTDPNFNCDAPCTNPPLRRDAQQARAEDAKPAAPKVKEPAEAKVIKAAEAKPAKVPASSDVNGPMAAVQLKDIIAARKPVPKGEKAPIL